jgi:hypothetical protein
MHEMEETGTGANKRSRPKYTLKQILEPDFRLPTDADKERQAIGALMALAGKSSSGVRVFKAKD